ncbi:hypothetical protein ERJ75_001386400 [Trypanosoma vivax]|nr:hypothetical protein ERJ75_001386400 [Trypanosoma vivax]
MQFPRANSARFRTPFCAVVSCRASRTVTKDTELAPRTRAQVPERNLSPHTGGCRKARTCPAKPPALQEVVCRNDRGTRCQSLSSKLSRPHEVARRIRVASKRSGRRARASRTRYAAPAPACRERGWKSLASNRARRAITPPFARRPCVALPRWLLSGKGSVVVDTRRRPSVDDPNSCDRVRVSTARWRRRRGARAWNAGVS